MAYMERVQGITAKLKTPPCEEWKTWPVKPCKMVQEEDLGIGDDWLRKWFWPSWYHGATIEEIVTFLKSPEGRPPEWYFAKRRDKNGDNNT